MPADTTLLTSAVRLELTLPLVDLIRVNLVTASELRRRLLFTQRRQGYFRLELRPVLRSRLLHDCSFFSWSRPFFYLKPWSKILGPLLLKGAKR